MTIMQTALDNAFETLATSLEGMGYEPTRLTDDGSPFIAIKTAGSEEIVLEGWLDFVNGPRARIWVQDHTGEDELDWTDEKIGDIDPAYALVVVAQLVGELGSLGRIMKPSGNAQ